MAIEADFKTAFANVTAYWFLRSFAVDRIDRTVKGTLVIFKDAATREAYKTALETVSKNNAELRKNVDLLDQFQNEWNAMEVKSEAAKAEFEAKAAKVRSDIANIQSSQQQQRIALQNNVFGAEANFDIPYEGVPIEEGSVKVADIYAWCMKNVDELKNSKQV